MLLSWSSPVETVGQVTKAGVDWDRFGPGIVWTLVLGIIVALAKGQGGRLVHLLFRSDPSRAVDTLIETLESKEGRTRMRALMDDLYKERMQHIDAQLRLSLDLAQTNRQILEGVTESIKLQGAALRTVETQVRDLPQMTRVLSELTEATKAISTEMEGVNIWMSRMDERERMRERLERRSHNEPDHPHRRQGDGR